MPHPTPPPTPPTLRILLLHGYTQTPTLFRAKTRALAKSLSRPFPSLQLSYVPAPHRLVPAEVPGYNDDEEQGEKETVEAYGWWKRKDRITKDGEGKHARETEVVYEGIEAGLSRIAEYIRAEGPFDGVIGFSQGAAAAAMVASLLEGQARKEAFEKAEAQGGMRYPPTFLGDVSGFVQEPFKFAVCYSGFKAPGKLYRGFYEPLIRTKVLNVMGQMDVVVEEVRGMQLVSACEGGVETLVVHPGGHFVPSQKPWLDAVIGFVKRCVEGEVKKEEKEEERVEDMDVPF